MNPVSFVQKNFLQERDRWLLWLPVFIGAGISAYFALPREPAFTLIVATPLLLVVYYLVRRLDAFAMMVIGLLTLALGFNAAQIETKLVARPLLSAPLPPTSVTGTLMRAEPLPEGARLTLTRLSIKDMPRDQRPASVRMKVRTPYTELPEAGSRVNLWGPLWPPNDPALPDGYDFRRNAFFKELGGTGISYVPPRVYETRYPPRFFWDGFNIRLERMRRALIDSVFAQLEEPSRGMVAALLSGSQAGINRDVMDAMRASGLSHLLSISGVHVSMMALLVYVPLRFVLALWPWFALRAPTKKIAAGLAIVATAFYTVLVGADPPTVRSALMTGIVFFAIITDRRAMSLRLVALAAAVIMLFNPSAAMGASFQMSFAAVLAMFTVYEKRLDTTPVLDEESPPPQGPRWHRFVLRHTKDIVVTSLLATAATTPFTIFHFQTFSFYGVFANMLGIPLTTLWIMPCLLLTYITQPFGGEALFIAGAGWGTDYLIALAHSVASWPWAAVPFKPMPAWAFGLMIAGGLWLCLWRGRWRWSGLALIALGSFYPLTVTRPSVYIADDKPVWAVMLRDGRMAAFGKRKEDFTIAQWRQYAGLPDLLLLSDKTMDALPEELSCDAEYCAYTPNAPQTGPTVIFVREEITPETLRTICANPALTVVSFKPLSDCPAPRVIDGVKLAAEGAHSLTLREGPAGAVLTVKSARAKGDLRPWSPMPLAGPEIAADASEKDGQ